MESRMDGEWQESLPTLGDLCEAIAGGRITYRERYGFVELTALDVRRLAREDRVLGRGISPTSGGRQAGASHARGLA